MNIFTLGFKVVGNVESPTYLSKSDSLLFVRGQNSLDQPMIQREFLSVGFISLGCNCWKPSLKPCMSFSAVLPKHTYMTL